jgi:hypothetical protein
MYETCPWINLSARRVEEGTYILKTNAIEMCGAGTTWDENAYNTTSSDGLRYATRF